MRSGGLPSRDSICAPIISSGSMIRRIGLEESDWSPVSSEVKSWPASNPASIRIVEPLFPQSSDFAGLVKSPSPWPRTRQVFPSAATETPISRRQFRVDAQSWLWEKFVIIEGPRASEATIAARWEIDLSPERVISPMIRCAGLTFILAILPEALFSGEAAKDTIILYLATFPVLPTFLTCN